MIINRKSKKDIISIFDDIYQQAKTYAADRNVELDRHEKQYQGDNEIDGSTTNADMVRNITYEVVESQVDCAIPAARVAAESWSERKQRNAQSIERMCQMQRDRLPFERMNDVDERQTYIFGASVWLIEWDSSIRTHNSVGDIKVTLIDPRDFFGQPNAYRIEDMDYCFLRFITNKEELQRRYGISEAEAEMADMEPDTTVVNTTTDGEDDNDTVTVIICFYKNEEGNICKFSWSGDAVLEDIEDYYKRKREKCTVCGRRRELCTCDNPKFETINDEYEELDHDIQCSEGYTIPAMSPVRNDDGTMVIERYESTIVTGENGEPLFTEVDGMTVPMSVSKPIIKMAPTRLPYYLPKTFPIVVRVNTSVPKSLYGQSDCEFLRPPQQAINKVETRIMQKLMRSGITPLVPEDAVISLNNSIFGQVIRLKPNENRNDYGTIDTQPNIQQDIMQAERLYSMAKRTVGITDSFQGFADTTAKSGEAKRLQVQQAAGRLSSKRQMKNAAYAEQDRIFFELYLAYADEPRPLVYKDHLGRTHGAKFNRYDFIHYDQDTGDYYFDDGYLFSVDTGAAYDRDKKAMWQMIMQFFQSSMYGPVDDPMTRLHVWLLLESYDFPNAHEMVVRTQDAIEQMQAQAQMAAQTMPPMDAQMTAPQQMPSFGTVPTPQM